MFPKILRSNLLDRQIRHSSQIITPRNHIINIAIWHSHSMIILLSTHHSKGLECPLKNHKVHPKVFENRDLKIKF